jgi:phosphoenolpyruvate synthase/pyruvate phosphate dikinase
MEPTFGKKADNLLILQNAGFGVPPFFVLSPKDWKKSLSDATVLVEKLQKLA